MKDLDVAHDWCFAGIQSNHIGMFTDILRDLDGLGSVHVTRFNIMEVSKLKPAVVISDVDDVTKAAPLEMLRQLRFVLADSFIAVYTEKAVRTWALACHNAGVNCVLLKSSTPAEIAEGIRVGLHTGCFTDPHVAAA